MADRYREGSRSDSIFSDNRNRSDYGRDDEDRGFFQRARDEVSSWFSDDDDWGRPNAGFGDEHRSHQRGGEGRFEDRAERYGARGETGGGSGGFGATGGAGTDYGMRTRGYEGDRGRDRHSERHPQTIGNESLNRHTSPSQRQQGSTARDYGAQGQASRGAYDARQQGQGRSEHAWQDNMGSGRFEREQSGQFGQRRQQDNQGRSGGSGFGYGDAWGYAGQDADLFQQRGQRPRSSSLHPDDHYRSWRERQLQELDRDYDEYCREREQQFHQDFSSWRQNRRGTGEDQSTNQGRASGSSGNDASSQDVLSLGTAQEVGTTGQGRETEGDESQTVSGTSTSARDAQGRQSAASGRSNRSNA